MSRRARTLSTVGESALIERIARRTGLASTKRWRLGIGDDAAILKPKPGFDLVLSSDAQVEGVHFRWGRETPRVVGRRALAVNLSDLAAMGAAPTGCLLSLAAPGDFELDVFDGIVAGFVFESKRYACPLVGGNLTRADRCSLHVTVVGEVPRGAALLRGRLRAGDELFVTGVLGAAALARRKADEGGTALTRVPVPRVAAGQRLVRSKATSACIDLSDGLATDLAHLLEGSGCGAEVDLGRIPTPRGFERGCREVGLDPIEAMLTGGEDYELLFARRPPGGREPSPGWERALGVGVTHIGDVVSQAGISGLPALKACGHHF
jgi:thiamine-monophosphate kinase